MTGPMLSGDYWTQWVMLPGVTIGRYTKADGATEYWRREDLGKWVKLPHWWHPKTFAYQPWCPPPWLTRRLYSCGQP